MSSGAELEIDWIAPGEAVDDVSSLGRGGSERAANAGGARAPRGAYLSDDEILGIEAPPVNGVIPNRARDLSDGGAEAGEYLQRDSSSDMNRPPRNDNENDTAQQTRHSSDTDASDLRAFREVFPGGAQEATALRAAAQAVDRLDAAIYSGDTRAQADVVSELARANPAAFRSLFAEAAKVLGVLDATGARRESGEPILRREREEWGTRRPRNDNAPNTGGTRNLSDGFAVREVDPQRDSSSPVAPRNDNAREAPRIANRPETKDLGYSNTVSPQAGLHDSPITSHESRQFDAAAYAAFERGTNEAVARDVRAAVSDTLARVLPEGVAEGAARRISEDIFQEIHRTLATDHALSQQVGEVLRARQFGASEQMRVAQLLSGRAKQLVPSVARRVIGEWTTSVLGTARTRSARQAAAASRVDIAAPSGSRDSAPLRPLSPREVDYARMSDDEILGM